jgi:hypothetical protein
MPPTRHVSLSKDSPEHSRGERKLPRTGFQSGYPRNYGWIQPGPTISSSLYLGSPNYIGENGGGGGVMVKVKMILTMVVLVVRMAAEVAMTVVMGKMAVMVMMVLVGIVVR